MNTADQSLGSSSTLSNVETTTDLDEGGSTLTFATVADVLSSRSDELSQRQQRPVVDGSSYGETQAVAKELLLDSEIDSKNGAHVSVARMDNDFDNNFDHSQSVSDICTSNDNGERDGNSNERELHEIVVSAAVNHYKEKAKIVASLPNVKSINECGIHDDNHSHQRIESNSFDADDITIATTPSMLLSIMQVPTLVQLPSDYLDPPQQIFSSNSFTPASNEREASQNEEETTSSLGFCMMDAVEDDNTITDRELEVMVMGDAASTTSELSSDDSQRGTELNSHLENPSPSLAVARQVSDSDIEQERTQFILEVRSQFVASMTLAEVVPNNNMNHSDGHVILPQSKRRRQLTVFWVSIACLILGVAATVSVVSKEKIGKSSNTPSNHPPNSSSPPTSSISRQSSTDAPTQTPVVYLPDGRRAFTSTPQLYAAIDEYHDSLVANRSLEDITATMTYGFPITTWDVSRITDFSRVFDLDRDQELDPNVQPMTRNLFNEDLSGWDVSNAVTMSGMFFGASKFVGEGLSDWNVGKVKDFSHMFARATAFNGNLSQWDTSSAVTMDGMFLQARSFDGDLSTLNLSQVQSMNFMFSFATSFTGGDLSRWDVGRVQDMREMFSYAGSFRGNVSSWNTASVLQMDHMFDSAEDFSSDISHWETSSVSNFEAMFLGSASFNGDISQWNTSSATIMSNMFLDAVSFSSDISLWDTGKVETMSGMFMGASNFNRDLASWDVSSLLDASSMFDMASMFNHSLCSWIDQLPPDATFTGMFSNSGCVNASDPTPLHGPFCFNCMLR